MSNEPYTDRSDRPAIELVVTPGDGDPTYGAAGDEPTADPRWQDEPQAGAGPAGSRRRRRIVVGAALAVGLLGVAAVGPLGWRVANQKDATLDTPDQVAGLVRDNSERARETAEYLRTGFAADIDLDSSVGAVYTDPGAAGRSVLIFGGTALIWQPGQDLDRLFNLVADEGGSVQGLRELPAGEMGGVMKCGSTPAEEGDIAVCGWADHGSVVLAMFPGRPVNESAELLRQIRSQIQTRD